MNITYNLKSLVFISSVVIFVNLLIMADFVTSSVFYKRISDPSFGKKTTASAMNEQVVSKQMEIYQGIVSDLNLKTAALTDARGGVGSGIAHISRRNGKLYSYLYAYNLADLPNNYWYEAWLVQQTPTQNVVSIGRLQKQADGSYVLYYIGNKEIQDHDFVVVSRETSTKKYDGTGTHILEGSAN